jgi:hypothetical protein
VRRQGDQPSRYDRDSPGFVLSVPVSQASASGRRNVPVWHGGPGRDRAGNNILFLVRQFPCTRRANRI